MGNSHSHHPNESVEKPDFSVRRRSSAKQITSAHVPALERLFQKLELTAEDDNGHPGEITRTTFENVFHGPLQLFGKLLYEQMVTNGHHHHGDKVRGRITCEQFVKAGKEVLKLFNETDQHKYYFKLFSQGKEQLDKEGALRMIHIAYALTLSSSMVPYAKNEKDEQVFNAVLESMFGMKSEIKFSEMERWMESNCPHMVAGVHNWVYTILTGSKMPEELEVSRVPMLERFTEGQHCMTMGMVWMLTGSLPHMFTHTEEKDTDPAAQAGTKNPLLTSFQFLMKLARLSRCQSWVNLYDSDEHGLSMNRFSHHVTSYNDPTITLVSFEGRNIYCIAEDVPWREGTSKFGREDTRLIQITPVYRVVQSGGPLVQWSITDRNIPKGIHFGQSGRLEVLSIPLDFDMAKHYGVQCQLHHVEMWGCGRVESLQLQQKQKQWERKEVEKQRSRKLHRDVNWEENPDKQLLSWGGVEVNHQYSRSGAM
ncbi:uncharacterized protein LOC128231966 [Mya arenaria]|uniref:uncharacterized protein LOC128231966 n=1 Tax=Mya arenaria TaxID=6604 RepID=UPI0022E62844|nr:uncharacterized protein LOC128231966 [Mya arenaria]